jgi:hypothetical protein
LRACGGAGPNSGVLARSITVVKNPDKGVEEHNTFAVQLRRNNAKLAICKEDGVSKSSRYLIARVAK